MAILLVYCLCSDFINFPWPFKTIYFQNCFNSTMTMPRTFESDCITETYTEAKEREHPRKHEQATCVPITNRWCHDQFNKNTEKHRWRIP